MFICVTLLCHFSPYMVPCDDNIESISVSNVCSTIRSLDSGLQAFQTRYFEPAPNPLNHSVGISYQ